VDTRLKLDVVWKKIKPLLSPIVTPEKMELQPLRELHELCSYHHYEYNVTTTKTGNVHMATVQIQVKGPDISGEGSNVNKRSAETEAAKHALAQLKVYSNFSVNLFLRKGLARTYQTQITKVVRSGSL
jgi:endoribonuclease Dicer